MIDGRDLAFNTIGLPRQPHCAVCAQRGG
jgi:molybdopterin-synthase adenylyltransferase